MSTRLKLTDSVVLNADEIVSMNLDNDDVRIYTTGTDFASGDVQNYFIIFTGSAGEASALKAAIEKALTSAPSGRVIKVPASSDYTITNFSFTTQF